MIEIKRSRVSLDRWELYPEDYDNFRLLAHIASASNIPMTITYHRFTVGPPREEDTSRLTLWRVDIDKSPLVTSIGRVDLAAFARGDHLG